MERDDWKIGFLAGIMLSMSISCDWELPEPEPTPEPTTEPTPIVPTPTAEPIWFGIYAPSATPLHTPFVIAFCGKTFANEVFVGKYRLGYLGDNRQSGCRQLVIPGFNTAGKRVIKIGNLRHEIDVFEYRNEK